MVFLIKLLCLLFVKLIYCKINEKIFETIPNSIIINSGAHLKHLLNSTDHTYLVYYYKKDSENSLLGAYYLTEIADKIKYIAEILLIDCDKMIKRDLECDREKFPLIMAYTPPVVRINPYTGKLNKHERSGFTKSKTSSQYLLEFIEDNVVSKLNSVTDRSFDKFKSSSSKLNKIVLFNNSTESSVSFKGLSNYFFDQVVMGVSYRDNEEMRKLFNIEKLPALVALRTPLFISEDHKFEIFKDDINDIDKVAEFIGKYSVKTKLYVKDLKYFKTKNNPIQSIFYETYLDFFSKLKNKGVFVVFTKGPFKFNSNYREMIDKINVYYEFALFDCSKITAFCKGEFHVTEFPSFHYYEPYDDVAVRLMDLKTVPLNDIVKFREFVNKLTTVSVDFANDRNITTVMKYAQKSHKLLLLVKKGSDLLPFKLISSIKDFQEKVEFIVYTQNEEEKRFNFTDNINTVLIQFDVKDYNM